MGPVSKIGTAILLGCFGVAAFCMVVLIGAAFMVPRMIDGAIENYTDTEPQLPPPPEIAEEEGEDLLEQVESFAEALEEGEPTEPLVLDEEELNYLLQEAAKEEDFGGGVYVELHEDQVSAMLSVPIDEDVDLGPWSRDLRGRYINGRAMLDVDVSDGKLEVNLDSFSIKGREVPGWLLDMVQDLIDDSGVLRSEDVRKITEKLESLDIDEDQLTVSGLLP